MIVLPLILMITVLMVPNQLIKNFDRFTGEQFDLSFRTRWEIWRTQAHIFQDFPISGSGFGTLPHIARRYQTFRWTYRLVHSESDYMQLL
ncbi:MAG: O-antigen ligase family protein, partial [Dehalococcoidia bacterium]